MDCEFPTALIFFDVRLNYFRDKIFENILCTEVFSCLCLPPVIDLKLKPFIYIVQGQYITVL
jgi:hypothetical protein